MIREGNLAKQSIEENEELRNYPRYRLDIRLKVITGIVTNAKAIYGRGSDISEGGMRMFVPADLTIGETVTLELTLPYTEQKLMVRGVLRNRLGFSYGVEYASTMSLLERQTIARACKALSLVQ